MNADAPPLAGDRPATAADARGDTVDRVLVAGMASADPASMEAFYDRYGAEVYGLIRGMVPDAQAAQELLQETMWQVWRLAPRYNPTRASVRTWLHVIMRSRVLDWRRRELRHPLTAALGEAPDMVDPGTSSEIGRAADRQDLIRAQEALSAAEREVIRLTYYRGLTQEEAARALGIPVGTLKSRVRSALGRLHERIEVAPREEEGRR